MLLSMIKAGIIGATGYAGAELVRILTMHPLTEISALSSISFEGQKLTDIYPSYMFVTDLVCENLQTVVEKSDIVFAALPHGLSQDIAAFCYKKDRIFIDLGADFRLLDESVYREWYHGSFIHSELHEQAVYGLPELFRKSIQNRAIIANPGCYATCVSLGLAPAVMMSLVEITGIVCDCKSGVTGAGRVLSQTTHFAELNEGFGPYKIACHRHTPEIEQTLSLFAKNKVTLTFVPHLLPVNRGILATCYGRVREGITFEYIREVYNAFYRDEPFIRLLPQDAAANIHSVKYSNFCDISLHFDNRTNTLIVVSAIDNMVKGAAGQAVQNMNVLFNIDEKTGLVSVPPAF